MALKKTKRTTTLSFELDGLRRAKVTGFTGFTG